MPGPALKSMLLVVLNLPARLLQHLVDVVARDLLRILVPGYHCGWPPLTNVLKLSLLPPVGQPTGVRPGISCDARIFLNAQDDDHRSPMLLNSDRLRAGGVDKTAKLVLCVFGRHRLHAVPLRRKFWLLWIYWTSFLVAHPPDGGGFIAEPEGLVRSVIPAFPVSPKRAPHQACSNSAISRS